MACRWTLTVASVALLVTSLAWVSASFDDYKDYRQVVLVEKHGFTRGRSVDISLVEAPGIQKLLVVVCKDSTLSVCQGFALDGKVTHAMLREPMAYTPEAVFQAFFGGPYLSKLFGPNVSGRVLKPTFTLAHQEDGSIALSYGFKDLGQQKSTIRPKPRHLDFDYIFIGAEVKIGVADPVGSVSSF